MKKKQLAILFTFALMIMPILNVHAIDSDSDGLDDLHESSVYTTDPSNPDTDGDGFLDGAEVFGGYNPKGEGSLTPEQIEAYSAAIKALEEAIEEEPDGNEDDGIVGDSGTAITSGEGTIVESQDEDGIVADSGASMTSGEGAVAESPEEDDIDNDPTLLSDIADPEIISLEYEDSETISDLGLISNVISENPVVTAKVNKIVTDKENNIWIATEEGLIKLADDKMHIYTEDQGLLGNNIMDISVHSDNVLWLVSMEGVTKFDLNAPSLNRAFTYYNQDNGLKTKLGEKIFVSQDGTIWLGTAGSGLFLFDGESWTPLEDDDLSQTTITDIKGVKNNIWVSTKSNGAFEIVGNTVTRHQTRNGIISNQVNSLFVSSNDTSYLITDFGISEYLNNNWSNIQTRGKINGNKVNTIYMDDENNMYIGTNEGVNKHISTDDTWVFIGIDDGVIGSLVTALFHQGDNIYIGTDKGISLLDTSKVIEEEVLEEPETTDEEPVLANPDDDIIEEEIDESESFNLDSLTSIFDEKMENAKNGDVASIAVLASPVVLMILLLLILMAKSSKRKKEMMGLDSTKAPAVTTEGGKPNNNTTDLPKPPVPPTPIKREETIASIGKPMGNIANLQKPVAPSSTPSEPTPLKPATPLKPVTPPTPPSMGNPPIPPKPPTPPSMGNPPIPPKPPTPPTMGNPPTPPKPPTPPTPPPMGNPPIPPKPPTPPTPGV